MERGEELRAALRLADGTRAVCRLCGDAETVTRADAAAYRRCAQAVERAAAACIEPERQKKT